MATHWFNAGLEFLASNAISGTPVTPDWRAAMLMSNTTADTENDGISVVSDLNTLDECDGSGYTREALQNMSVSKDDANDRALIDADDIDFGEVGAATRAVQGVLIYHHDTDDDSSIPLVWLEFASNKTMDGSQFIAEFDADGISEVAAA